MGRFPGGTDDALYSINLFVSVLTMFGNLSAKLLSSHGSVTTSNKQGFDRGLQSLPALLVHVTVASLRNFLDK